jgi:predicted aldo/keto reductase-like oxidoreductase
MAILELGIMRHHVQEKAKSQELIDWAMSHGVNHFEACWFYMNGECEPFLYSLLEKYKREDYYICGKLPIHNVLDRMTHQDLFEEQLRRVPGHYFDTYILQALDDLVYEEIQQKKIVEYFLEQKRLGKIKRFGLSIQCLPSTFKKYLEWGCWDVVQMPINYYDWFLCRYDECYKLACEYNIPIIAQAPVKGGLVVKPRWLPTDTFGEYSLTQAACSFFEHLDNIEMILCGNSSLETFKQTYEAFENPVEIPMEKYKDAIDVLVSRSYVNCTRCGKCIQACPQGLPIAAFMTFYNLGLKNKSYFTALDVLKSASGGEPSHLCRACGRCESICPQGLKIPELWSTHIFELRT